MDTRGGRRLPVVRAREFVRRAVRLLVDHALQQRAVDGRGPPAALRQRIEDAGGALPSHPALQRGHADVEACGDDRVRLGSGLVGAHGECAERRRIRIGHTRNRSLNRHQLK